MTNDKNLTEWERTFKFSSYNSDCVKHLYSECPACGSSHVKTTIRERSQWMGAATMCPDSEEIISKAKGFTDENTARKGIDCCVWTECLKCGKRVKQRGSGNWRYNDVEEGDTGSAGWPY